MKPELTEFSNGLYAVIGEHYNLSQARYFVGVDYYARTRKPIAKVSQAWAQFELLKDTDPPMPVWFLLEKKPSHGLIRKATVIE